MSGEEKKTTKIHRTVTWGPASGFELFSQLPSSITQQAASYLALSEDVGFRAALGHEGQRLPQLEMYLPDRVKDWKWLTNEQVYQSMTYLGALLSKAQTQSIHTLELHLLWQTLATLDLFKTWSTWMNKAGSAVRSVLPEASERILVQAIQLMPFLHNIWIEMAGYRMQSELLFRLSSFASVKHIRRLRIQCAWISRLDIREGKYDAWDPYWKGRVTSVSEFCSSATRLETLEIQYPVPIVTPEALVSLAHTLQRVHIQDDQWMSNPTIFMNALGACTELRSIELYTVATEMTEMIRPFSPEFATPLRTLFDRLQHLMSLKLAVRDHSHVFNPKDADRAWPLDQALFHWRFVDDKWVYEYVTGDFVFTDNDFDSHLMLASAITGVNQQTKRLNWDRIQVELGVTYAEDNKTLDIDYQHQFLDSLQELKQANRIASLNKLAIGLPFNRRVHTIHQSLLIRGNEPILTTLPQGFRIFSSKKHMPVYHKIEELDGTAWRWYHCLDCHIQPARGHCFLHNVTSLVPQTLDVFRQNDLLKIAKLVCLAGTSPIEGYDVRREHVILKPDWLDALDRMDKKHLEECVLRFPEYEEEFYVAAVLYNGPQVGDSQTFGTNVNISPLDLHDEKTNNDWNIPRRLMSGANNMWRLEISMFFVDPQVLALVAKECPSLRWLTLCFKHALTREEREKPLGQLQQLERLQLYETVEKVKYSSPDAWFEAHMALRWTIQDLFKLIDDHPRLTTLSLHVQHQRFSNFESWIKQDNISIGGPRKQIQALDLRWDDTLIAVQDLLFLRTMFPRVSTLRFALPNHEPLSDQWRDSNFNLAVNNLGKWWVETSFHGSSCELQVALPTQQQVHVHGYKVRPSTEMFRGHTLAWSGKGELGYTQRGIFNVRVESFSPFAKHILLAESKLESSQMTSAGRNDIVQQATTTDVWPLDDIQSSTDDQEDQRQDALFDQTIPDKFIDQAATSIAENLLLGDSYEIVDEDGVSIHI